MNSSPLSLDEMQRLESGPVWAAVWQKLEADNPTYLISLLNRGTEVLRAKLATVASQAESLATSLEEKNNLAPEEAIQAAVEQIMESNPEQPEEPAPMKSAIRQRLDDWLESLNDAPPQPSSAISA